MSTHLGEAFYGYMEMVVKPLQAEKRRLSAILASYLGLDASILGQILREVKSRMGALARALPPDFPSVAAWLG